MVRITAEGDDEVEAIATIRAAIEAGLGEEVAPAAPAVGPPATAAPSRVAAPSAPPPRPPPAARRRSRPAPRPRPPAGPAPRAACAGLGAVAGIAIAPGLALPRAGGRGRARRSPATPATRSGRPPTAAEAQLEALAARIRAAGRPDDAGIFEAQAVLATDPTIVEGALARVAAGADPADRGRRGGGGARPSAIASLGDELLAARAADVRDVGARIARILRGETLALPDRPVIAVADDLPPSVTAEIPAAFLRGIALAGGSRTAHAVILARGLGIPCVVGCAGLVEAVDDAAGGGRGGARSPSTARPASS